MKKIIVVVYVPNILTNEFQPLHLSVNGPAKQFLSGKFQEWYAHEVAKQIEAGKNVYAVDVSLRLSVMKRIHANWIPGLYDYLRNMTSTIIKGVDISGNSEGLTIEIEDEGPFRDLD